jgi:hypothetical protein
MTRLITKRNIQKMGFIARLSHYEYVVMPLGLTFVVITLNMVYSNLSYLYIAFHATII